MAGLRPSVFYHNKIREELMKTSSDIHPFWKVVWHILWFIILAPCAAILVLPLLLELLRTGPHL